MIMTKPRVLIESPFGNNADGTRCEHIERCRNGRYLKHAMQDSLFKGEAPFASHGLYPFVGLDDDDPVHRRMGMEAGFAWGAAAEKVVIYEDHGITPGMREGIERWEALGIPITYRKIGPEPRV